MNATVALMTTEMSESFSDVMVMVHAAQWGSLISILVSFCLFEGNGSEGGGGGGGGGGPGCIRDQNMDSRKFRKAITFNEHVVNFGKAYCRP